MVPRVRVNVRIFAVLLLSTMAIGLVVVGPVNPADKPKPWVAKDWTKWTWEDCIQVLNYSPWAKISDATVVGRLGSRYNIAQLRSALPIRQALLRNLQIQKHYDKMDDQKKREFDQQNGGSPDEQQIDHVAILIDNVRVYNGQRNSLGPEPATQIALQIGAGALVLPTETNKVNYPPSQIENDATDVQFEYIFPRMVNGKPLCSPDDLFLGIDLGDPLIVDKKTGHVTQQDFRKVMGGFMFNVSDLMYKGKLGY
jgi:hypothetical protein